PPMTSAAPPTTRIRLTPRNILFKHTLIFIFLSIWNCARSTIRSAAFFACLRHIDFVAVGWNESGGSQFPGAIGVAVMSTQFGIGHRAPWPRVRVFAPPADNGPHLPRLARRL